MYKRNFFTICTIRVNIIAEVKKMTGKELVQLLVAKGYKIDRINGSHYILEK